MYSTMRVVARCERVPARTRAVLCGSCQVSLRLRVRDTCNNLYGLEKKGKMLRDTWVEHSILWMFRICITEVRRFYFSAHL